MRVCTERVHTGEGQGECALRKSVRVCTESVCTGEECKSVHWGRAVRVCTGEECESVH